MSANILIYDIETSPNLGYTWGKWDQNVLGYVREKYIISVAWHWYGEKKVHVAGLDDFPRAYAAAPHDDASLVQILHDLFMQADIIVAHNGNSFDQKETQRRFIVHGMPTPSPYFQVDTKLVARRSFRFNSNSLDDLGFSLGLGRKIKHQGFEMWRAIYEDQDPDAWKAMKKYNKQDVVLLTKVYETFLKGGWIPNHPNLANFDDPAGCPKCGAAHEHLVRRGYKRTQTMRYLQVQCAVCNSYSRVRPGKTGPRHV